MKIELTEGQIRALLAFLSRVNVQGQEAIPLAELIQIFQDVLNKPKEDVKIQLDK